MPLFEQKIQQGFVFIVGFVGVKYNLPFNFLGTQSGKGCQFEFSKPNEISIIISKLEILLMQNFLIKNCGIT